MIRITVELWPHGSPDGIQTLATADIWNDGTGDQHTGNYGFVLYGKNRRLMRSGSVFGFRRSRHHVWWLVAIVLRTAFENLDRKFHSSVAYVIGSPE